MVSTGYALLFGIVLIKFSFKPVDSLDTPPKLHPNPNSEVMNEAKIV